MSDDFTSLQELYFLKNIQVAAFSSVKFVNVQLTVYNFLIKFIITLQYTKSLKSLSQVNLIFSSNYLAN